jgi:hypothetical protein
MALPPESPQRIRPAARFFYAKMRRHAPFINNENHPFP